MHNGTVVKLNIIRSIRRSNLTAPLQLSDFINERWMSPDFDQSFRMSGSDHVRYCFFDHTEPVEF